jgi:hypothetical protein
VLKEPLLHFVVLAVGLFGLSRVYSNKPAPEPSQQSAPEQVEKPARQLSDTIVVSQQRIESLILRWHKTWQRPPTREEVNGLIEDYIREEVFYREALAMGLDRDDTLIRRRLRQKLEFLAEDFADTVEPTDQELQQFLDEHPDSFRHEGRVTFRQVYLNRDRRGDSLEADAKHLLDKLRSKTDVEDSAELGDPFLLPHFHKDLRESEVANLFGRSFISQLRRVEIGKWSGPIESGYGVHLVLVHERTKGRLPELKEVRDAVRREWFASRRATSKEKFYQNLRQRYKVVVETPELKRDGENTPDAK